MAALGYSSSLQVTMPCCLEFFRIFLRSSRRQVAAAPSNHLCLLDLPNEVLTRIVECMPVEGHVSWRRKNLCALLQTCRHLHAVVTPILYEDIEMGARNEFLTLQQHRERFRYFEMFLIALENQPERVTMVRTLRLAYSGLEGPELIYFPNMLRHFTSLRVLTLQDSMVDLANYLGGSGDLFPHLKSCTLKFLRVRDRANLSLDKAILMLWSQPRLESMDIAGVNCGLRPSGLGEDLYREPLKRVHFYACRLSGRTLEALVGIRAISSLTVDSCWGKNLSAELAPLAPTLEELCYKPSTEGSGLRNLNLGSFARLRSLAVSPCAIFGMFTLQTLSQASDPAPQEIAAILQNMNFNLPPTLGSLTIGLRKSNVHTRRNLSIAYNVGEDESPTLPAAPEPLDSRNAPAWYRILCDILLDILPPRQQVPGRPGLQSLRLQLSKLPRHLENQSSLETWCPKLAAAWRLESWCAREGIRCDLHYEWQRDEFEWVWGAISDHADVDWHYSPGPWHYSTRSGHR